MRIKVLSGIFTVLVLGLLVLQTPLLHRARTLTWQMIVAVIAQRAGIGSLTVENDVMTQLADLQVENIRLRAQQHDYEILRTQLAAPTIDSLRALPALVAARPLNTWRSLLLVNRGATAGIVPGAPVVINGNILVGFVTELTTSTATVRLLLHPDTSIPAEIIDTDEQYISGLLRGLSHTAVQMTTIPRDQAISLGQSVVTTGQDTIPPGLLIGTVDDITAKENEAYQEARIALPYNPDTIRAVTILLAP